MSDDKFFFKDKLKHDSAFRAVIQALCECVYNDDKSWNRFSRDDQESIIDALRGGLFPAYTKNVFATTGECLLERVKVIDNVFDKFAPIYYKEHNIKNYVNFTALPNRLTNYVPTYFTIEQTTNRYLIEVDAGINLNVCRTLGTIRHGLQKKIETKICRDKRIIERLDDLLGGVMMIRV